MTKLKTVRASDVVLRRGDDEHEKFVDGMLGEKQTGNSVENMRRWLPYGMWTCADGREVLFNRRYRPIFSRLPGRAATFADHEEFVSDICKQGHFFSDDCLPWGGNDKRKCLDGRARSILALSNFITGSPVAMWKERNIGAGQ